MVALSVLIIAYSSEVEKFARYGYPGIFLFSVLASATVVLPAPSLVIVFSMGAVLNPFWVAVLAGVGASIGELSGYIAGLSGNVVVENTQTYERIRTWMEQRPRFTGWFLLVLAFLPLPFFDMAGIAAGALRVPVLRFLSYIVFGKILKMLVVAYLGNAWFAWMLEV